MSRLAGIEVLVPIPAGVTSDDVEARLFELLRARAPVTALRDGAALAIGDEVLLDAVGYSAGSPMSAQVDAWMRLQPNPMLPGLFEQIADGKLGEDRVIRIRLADDHPQQARRGQPAAFVVKTKAANRPAHVDVDDEAALWKLGRGKTREAVRASLREELLRERATALVEEAKRRFLDEVARRLSPDLAEQEVEHELVRVWRLEEGDALVRQGASDDEQGEARAAFVANEERRRDARRRLFSDRLLEGVAAELGVAASLDDVVTLVVHAASSAKLPLSELHTRLTTDASLLSQMAGKLRQSHALSWLLSQGTVSFVA